jgi:hypothetical protein
MPTIKEFGATLVRVFKDVFTKENIENIVKGLGFLFTAFGKFMAWAAEIAAGPFFKAISWIFEKIASFGDVIAGAWLGAKAGAAIGTVVPGVGNVVGALGGAVIGGASAYALRGTTGADEALAEQEAFGAVPRASGGDVVAHRPYLVGEDGPEVMFPKTDGVVVPSHGGLVAVPVNMTLRLMLDSREIQRIPFNTTLPVNVSVAGA